MPDPLVLEGTLTREDQAASPYSYLAFEVPEGTTQISVRLSYDKDDDNVLDLGITDPTLETFPSLTGLRGWSGGARSEFVLARDHATPGYLSGEIPAGTWHIILGLYKIRPQGCPYRVEIMLDDTPRSLTEGAKPIAVPRARAEAGWYKGDLHSHCYHSDAKGSLEDLVRAAGARGLEFLAVTDHNTSSHHRFLAELSSPDLLLIPGEEVTTDRGHANIWGVPGTVDFRITEDAQLPELIEHVHARGGLFSINHPKQGGPAWDYPFPQGIDCFEAWQSPWLKRNEESLAHYDVLLREGRRLTLVGGSDRHQPGWPDPDPSILQIGSPTTWLKLEELSITAVLKGLKAGQGFVSESPQGPTLKIRLEDTPMGSVHQASPGQAVSAHAEVNGAQGDLLRWVSATGVCRELTIAQDPFEDRWSWQAQGPFLRAEIVAQASRTKLENVIHQLAKTDKIPPGTTPSELLKQRLVRALSNPVYVGQD